MLSPMSANNRRTQRPLAFAAASSLVIVLLGPACGSGDEGRKSGASNSEEERAAEELVAEFCDGLATCCATQVEAFDRAACEAGARTELDSRQPSGEHMRFNRSAVDACLASIRSTLPSCHGIELETCNRIYVGTLAPGESCESTEQCAPVADAAVTCAGVCKAGRRAAEGENCACTRTLLDNCAQVPGEPPFNAFDPNLVTYGECHQADGLACVGLHCVRAPGEGSACLGALCAPPLVCNDAGSCVQPTPVGQPCVDCGRSAYCDDGNLCAALHPTGAACELDLECASSACETAASIMIDSICVTPTTGAAHGTRSECAGDVHL